MSVTTHGTLAGYQRHHKNGERPCDDCQLAGSAYVKDWRRTTRGVGMHHWPTSLPGVLLDQVGALGAVTALSWRWSA